MATNNPNEQSIVEESQLPKPVKVDSVELGYGYFDVLNRDDGLHIYGWMLAQADAGFTSFGVYLNHELMKMAESRVASEIKLTDAMPHGDPWLFEFILARPIQEIPNFSRIDVLAYENNRVAARLSTLFRTDADKVPTPPEELMYRVTGNRTAWLVKASGQRCACEFLDAIARHRDLASVRRLLDWGCGCGRVTVHLVDCLSRYKGLEVYGCDIDGEAIAWCNQNLYSGRFSRTEPYPPVPWEEATFDVVVSCSVFTHLTRAAQKAWLTEMRRLIAPGGLLIASSTSNFTNARIPPDGFSDDIQDSMLDGIAPRGYYRGTSQTREYTMREWSKYFEILEIIENGIESSQDLVVMRRPNHPAPGPEQN